MSDTIVLDDMDCALVLKEGGAATMYLPHLDGNDDVPDQVIITVVLGELLRIDDPELSALVNRKFDEMYVEMKEEEDGESET